MTKIERSIVIDRPIDEVFEFTHDLTKNLLWQATLVEVVLLTDGPMRAGSRWREVHRFLGKRIETVVELTEYEPNTRSAVKTVSGPVPLSGTYLLEPVDGATRFTVTGEVNPQGILNLAEPVLARMAGRELESSLGHLEELLGSRSGGAITNVVAALSDDRVLRA